MRLGNIISEMFYKDPLYTKKTVKDHSEIKSQHEFYFCKAEDEMHFSFYDNILHFSGVYPIFDW